MRRMGAVLAALAVVMVAVLAVALAGSGEQSGNRVAALFDSVTGLVEGQDVTVAGVPVGAVQAVELTEEDKAQVTMDIDPRLARFYADASCTLENKFLLGERFVNCDPGRPRAGPLASREEVPTVPLEHTSGPVEADLVLSFAQLPYRERLQLLLNELGIAVAARGEDINAVIRRAAPALRDTRRVLAIVDSQRDALGGAISSTDRVLASLARRPRRLTGFVEQAANVSSRLAAHSGELERTTRELPGLLREAQPALADLDSFAVDTTPLVLSLRRSAPSVRRLFAQLDPFSDRALPAVRA
ncbi:MAG: MlaD family protein, partial [Solirubrobacterales bacterium]